MKKIIEGKVYNTDTAKELGSWDNGYIMGDFDWCSETLYKKRTGEFFLFGEGGARSKYSKCEGDGNSWTGGEDITPLSEKDAKKWAEERLKADEYLAIFAAEE